MAKTSKKTPKPEKFERKGGLVPAPNLNVRWFKDQMARVGLLAKDVAEQMEINPTVLSHIFSGRRNLKLREASKLASILQVPLADVLANAGVDDIDQSVEVMAVNATSQQVVPVKGWVNSSLEIIWQTPKDLKNAPNPLPNHKLVCVRCQTASGAFEGLDGALVYFYDVSPGTFDPESLGRLCVVEFDGKSYLRILKRGYISGRHNLAMFNGQPAEEGVHVTTATPVVWMKL